VPPGWPEAVHPPGSEDFGQTAIAWLLDVVPPEYRSYAILRRHPAALASMAWYHTRRAWKAPARATKRPEPNSPSPPRHTRQTACLPCPDGKASS
jgi:hypothetical protein